MVKRKEMPDWGEFVLCTVTRITPYAAWCRLDEYEGKEGMIHVSEVAGKWVHDIRDFVKPNKQYVAKVVKIDLQKGHIALSIKRVTKYDSQKKMNAFRREQRAEKIMSQIAKELGKTADDAYETFGQALEEKFEEIFLGLEEMKKSPELLEELEIDAKWTKAINNVLEKLFIEKETTIKAELDIKSYAADGVKKIKAVLEDLEATGASVKYISAPKYRVQVATKDPKTAEKNLVDKLEAIIKHVESKDFDGEGSYKLLKS
jgi:translation initiation factor 2 subunit 1